MPTLAAEGTTFTFDDGVRQDPTFDMVSIGASQDGSPVEVTTLSSLVHEFINGIPAFEITCELKGSATLAKGDTGQVTIGYNDGGSEDFGEVWFVVTKVDVNAAVGGTIDMSATFAVMPTPA